MSTYKIRYTVLVEGDVVGAYDTIYDANLKRIEYKNKVVNIEAIEEYLDISKMDLQQLLEAYKDDVIDADDIKKELYFRGCRH